MVMIQSNCSEANSSKTAGGISMNPIFENLYATKELQSVLCASVCEAYGLPLTEVLVLLFLSKNKDSDTATDIVDKLKIAK